MKSIDEDIGAVLDVRHDHVKYKMNNAFDIGFCQKDEVIKKEIENFGRTLRRLSRKYSVGVIADSNEKKRSHTPRLDRKGK